MNNDLGNGEILYFRSDFLRPLTHKVEGFQRCQQLRHTEKGASR